MKLSSRYLFLGLGLLFLAGCVSGKAVVLDVGYTKVAEPPKLAPQAKKVAVAVSLFEDGRAVKDRIGIRKGYRGAPDYFQYAGTSLPELVTKAVEEQLKKAGIRTQLISPWDLEKETIPPAGQDFVLGGRLDSFWVEADSRWMGSKTKVRIELALALASPKERRILWKNVITSVSEYREPFFSRDRAQSSFSNAFSSAINKILLNPELQGFLGIAPPPAEEGKAKGQGS